MINAERRVSAEEFLGAGKRFEPISTEGRMIIFSGGLFWRQPPYLHEKTLVSAWVKSVEEIAQGGIFNQHIKDLSTLFLWIYSQNWEPMVTEMWEKRTVRPPFWSSDGRKLMFLQAKELLDICSRNKENQGQMVVKMLEEDLKFLRQAGIFRLTEQGLTLVKRNIEKELKRGIA